MGKLVSPKVYYIGATSIDMEGLKEYLTQTDNSDFYKSMMAARSQGLSDGEILVSFYAKLCYASLTLGKNDNVTRIRDIPDNLRNCLDQGHGSVFEHCQLNFVVHNCSRVFETELVRHRVGTAFSILSGRYERVDYLDLVYDPILDSVKEEVLALQEVIERRYNDMVKKLDLDNVSDHSYKKKLTSALRRMLPQGKAREVGFSVNLRAIRHIVQMRTGRQSEWEIRDVFGQVYRLVKDKYPLVFYGAKEEVVDELLEVSGMKTQPY